MADKDGNCTSSVNSYGCDTKQSGWYFYRVCQRDNSEIYYCPSIPFVFKDHMGKGVSHLRLTCSTTGAEARLTSSRRRRPKGRLFHVELTGLKAGSSTSNGPALKAGSSTSNGMGGKVWLCEIRQPSRARDDRTGAFSATAARDSKLRRSTIVFSAESTCPPFSESRASLKETAK